MWGRERGSLAVEMRLEKSPRATFCRGHMKGFGLYLKSIGEPTKGLYFWVCLHWLQGGHGWGRIGGRVTVRSLLESSGPGVREAWICREGAGMDRKPSKKLFGKLQLVLAMIWISDIVITAPSPGGLLHCLQLGGTCKSSCLQLCGFVLDHLRAQHFWNPFLSFLLSV